MIETFEQLLRSRLIPFGDIAVKTTLSMLSIGFPDKPIFYMPSTKRDDQTSSVMSLKLLPYMNTCFNDGNDVKKLELM